MTNGAPWRDKNKEEKKKSDSGSKSKNPGTEPAKKQPKYEGTHDSKYS